MGPPISHRVKVVSCKVTGCEVLSDAWADLNEKYEEVPEGVYVAQSRMVAEGDYAVYDGNAFGGDEEEDPDVVKVNDIVSKFQLQQAAGLGKKDFKAMFMGHVKAVMKQGQMKKKAKESEEGKAALDKFQASAKSALKFFLSVFKDCDIYMNEDQDASGAYVIGWWNPNAEVTSAPQMCVWMEGCTFRKL